MTIAELIQFVQYEAGLPGDNKLIGFIVKTMEQILAQYTKQKSYPECLVIQQQTACTAGGTSITLASDLQTLDKENVFFYHGTGDDDFWNLFESTNLDIRSEGGLPRRFQRVGSLLFIHPASEVTTDDSVVYNYYKSLSLATLTAAFPIPSLEDVIKNETLNRVVRLTDSKKAAIYKQEAKEGFQKVSGMD